MFKLRTYLSLSGFLTLAFFAASCKKDNTFSPPDIASIRFVHAAPNAPSVNILLNDSRFGDSVYAFLSSAAPTPTSTPITLTFPGATTHTQGFVSAGSNRVRVFPASPRATPRSGTAVLDATLDLGKDAIRTVFVIGNSTLEALVANDDRITTILDTLDGANGLRAGQGAVRVVHASLSATPLNVNVIARPTGSTAAATTLFSGVTPRSVTDYATVTAGNYDLFVLRAGGASDTLARALNTAINSRRVFTVYARGTIDSASTSPRGFNVSILTDR